MLSQLSMILVSFSDMTAHVEIKGGNDTMKYAVLRNTREGDIEKKL